MAAPVQLDLLAQTSRRRAIQRAEDGASAEWRRTALQAIRACAVTLREFTADDVWDRMVRQGVRAGAAHPAALGPVFLRAARLGEIEKTGALRPSRQVQRHRDLTVWRRGGLR